MADEFVAFLDARRLAGGDPETDVTERRQLAATLPGEVLELPDANHSLVVKGRRNATASAHAAFVRALGRWLG